MNGNLSAVQSLSLFTPELILGGTAAGILISDLVLKGREARPKLLVYLALSGLIAAGAFLFCCGGAAPAGLFGGMVSLDLLGTFFKGFFVVVGVLGVLFAALSDEVDRERVGEYLALLVCLVLGMSLLATASNLLMIYLSLEFVSIASYVLSGFKRADKKSSEAALKYVIFGAVASGTMLYGLSLLYGLLGTMDLAAIHERVAAVAARGATAQVALLTAIVLTLAGFLYKIAAVPFHMWCPDVYEGAPTPFTAFLSVGPKAAGFAVLIRFFFVAFVDGTTGSGPSALPWPELIGIVSMATMTMANLVALTQTNVKRLLAWSSVAHAGYILMGFVLVTGEGVHAVMLYLCLYLFMNLGAFLAVMAVRDATGSEEVLAYKGLGSRSPVVAVTFAVFLFSLTGLPPLAGFIGKFYLFAAVLHKGGLFYYILALIGVANSVVSLYYYASVVRAMFLENARPDAPALSIKPAYVALLVLLAVPTIGLGIYWHPLSQLASASLSLYMGP